MCGIAGFERRDDDACVAHHLKRRLAQRGPDGAWFEQVGDYGLVQTRLAIIDLSERVRYPIRNEAGDLWLLFNGEVYEYLALRRELEHHGHRFRTNCDAEVVLHGYEQWGTNVFARLDGMFALALLHAPTGELTLARDPLGIKPLLYTTEGRFAFSSDAISLVSAGLVPGMIDYSCLNDYCAFHYIRPPRTGLHGVSQLLPGHLLRRTGDGSMSTDCWSPAPFATAVPSSERVDVVDAEDALDRCVRGQLIADVPVGVFLSSGLDSSLVLDSAVRAGTRPKAFTVSFKGHGDYDEVPTAGRFAAHLGVAHEIVNVSTGFVDTLSLVAPALDQPLGDASAIATTHLSRSARQEVTVALSGTGGDDLFAGYYRHRAHLLAPLLGVIPTSIMRAVARVAGPRGGERRSVLQLARSYVARLAALEGHTGLGHYHQLSASACSPVLKGLVDKNFMQDGRPEPTEEQHIAAAVSTLRAIQAIELSTYLPADLLMKEDRTAMAVGLEVRVPLLGDPLLQLAQRTPDRQKIGAFAGKRLLREVARRRLPAYVRRTRKRGFAVPLADFFSGPWRSEAIEWFSDSASSIADGRRAAKLLAAGALPATDAWALAAFLAWCNTVERARGDRARAPA